MKTTTRTTTLLAGLVLAIGIPVALAGCSGAGSGTADGASAAAASGIGAKWGACMRDAGYDVEDPSDEVVQSGAVIAPSNVSDPEAYNAAGQKCSQSLGVEGQSQDQKQKWARQYEQAASCIREEYPEYPEQQEGGLSFSEDEFPGAAEPAFQERVQECLQEYAPDTKTQNVG